MTTLKASGGQPAPWLELSVQNRDGTGRVERMDRNDVRGRIDSEKAAFERLMWPAVECVEVHPTGRFANPRGAGRFR